MADDCRVVIYDDDTDRARDVWQPNMLAMNIDNFILRVPNCEGIQSELNQLHKRRMAADNGDAPYSLECELDNADVLVVDYDLRQLDEHKGFATGEEVAYAARMFSKVKIIVVVNHPDIGLNDFDLNLQRDRNLKADVYIGHEQIANPALWRRDVGHDGFAPWGWPVLIEDVAQFDKCCEQVSSHWEENVLSYFGFDQGENRLSSEMLAFLGMPKSGMTFEEIYGEPEDIRTRPFVRPKDLVALVDDQERLLRVMTAVLKKWLRRWVLPPQTVLADAPHLAAILPWGLNDYQNASQWKSLCERGIGNNGIIEKVFRQEVLENHFEYKEWIGRPAFFVQPARITLEAQEEPTGSFEFSNVPDLLFAEDLSRFISAEDAIEYDLLLGGQQQVRAVCNPTGLELKSDNFSPGDVVYIPQSMLA